jgi:hypothetical protein
VHQSVTYRTETPGGGSVYGAIIGWILLVALLACIVVSVGPVIDYFANYVGALPDSPYKESVLPMYPWAYAFITLTAILGGVMVYRTIAKHVVYTRWN